MPLYLQPNTLDDAVGALASQPLTIVAGGTDYYPARVGKPLDDDVLDISRIEGLRGIEDAADYVRIGALTTWTDIMDAALPDWFNALKLAAREVGGVQIQNAGTVAGNLCNASPAADGVPPLLAMNAELELNSVRGSRLISLEKFIISNRETRCGRDEMVTALRIPKPANPATSIFLKLGARKYLVISIVMVAAVIERTPDNTVSAARIAVGSCATVAKRLRLLERALVGQHLSGDLGALVTPDLLSILRPITDVRGTADYRRDAAVTLVQRALSQLGANP
jgi:CO/xanthine dehydrogenase FAD-binding subunit